MNLKALLKKAFSTVLLSMLCAVAFAQTATGVVKDKTGEPMIGVNVLVKGTTNGTITDFDGNFSIPGVPEGSTLVVSYIGYLTQEVKSGQNLIVVLQEDTKTLDEVVVVGYGVVKKSDLTGSVGSIKSETIASKGSTSLMESLQGQVAGVNITQSSSRAGDGFSIQIRGKSSMGDATSPLYVIDGVVCDNMDFLNPMDIEKVDILKDASSTAIYGSRATNGVVMITTKKGDSNASKATVSYDGYYGFREVANMPEFMSGEEFMKYRFGRYLTSKQDAATGLTTWDMSDSNYYKLWCNGSPVVQQMYKDGNYTDWADLITRDGSQQNHFINISGAGNNITYRVGLGYQNEGGILYDDYERWNLKGAVDHKINDKLSIGFSANLATSNKKFGSKNSVNNGFAMTPVMAAHYWEGDNAGEPILQPGKDAVLYPNGGGPTSTYNPIVDRENSKDDTRTYNAMANAYLQFSPIKELILKTTFSPMYQKVHRGQFYTGETEARRNQGTNLAEDSNDEVFSFTWDTQANFIKSFGDHNLNALALFSVYQQKEEGNYIKITNMPFDVSWHNWGAGTVESKSSYYRKISMLSYVARINYNYKDKYLVTLSSRWDGSSKFAKDNRWGMFPSAAVAWRVNQEEWMKDTSDWLSNLKLRLSFGITGNNAGVGPYDTQSLANQKYYYNFGNSVANGFGYAMSNAELTWEKTTELNFGIDFGFLSNRITGSIDLYNKDSKDLLMEMQTPFEMGSATGAIVSNVGKVNNKGIEIQLNTTNISNKDWHWTTSFSFARNINKIVELNGEKNDLVGNKWFIGQPIDVVYGYKMLGICTAEQAKAFAADPNQKTKFYEGEMIYWDKTGDGKVDAADRCILGHNAPTWTGSFTSNLTYKNWDFSVNVYTSQGGTVYSPFMSSYCGYGSRGTQHIKMDFYIPDGAPILADPDNFQVIDGTPTNVKGNSNAVAYQKGTHYGSWPYPTSTNGNGGGALFNTSGEDASHFFVDNSYVKVKNITLGYTFPQNWLKKIHVSNLRLYVNVMNPFTFTDYKGFDPEWADAQISGGAGGPSSRTYQIGVNLKF